MRRAATRAHATAAPQRNGKAAGTGGAVALGKRSPGVRQSSLTRPIGRRARIPIRDDVAGNRRHAARYSARSAARCSPLADDSASGAGAGEAGRIPRAAAPPSGVGGALPRELPRQLHLPTRTPAPTDSLGTALRAAFTLHARRPCLGFPVAEGGAWGWRWLDYAAVLELADSVDAGLDSMLRARGWVPGTRTPRVALCGGNRLEWYATDLALAAGRRARGASIALHGLPHLTAANAAHALRLCEPHALVVAPECAAAIAEALRAAQMHERPTILMDVDPLTGGRDAGVDEAQSELPHALLFSEVASAAHLPAPAPARRDAEDEEVALLGVIFTSGSTGRPKGVPLLRATWARELTHYPADELVALSYQPLSYITDRHHVHGVWWNGGRVAVLHPQRGAAAAHQPSLFEATASAQPTVLFAVPRTLDVLRQTSTEAAAASPGCSAGDAATRVLGRSLHTVVVGGQALSNCTRRFLERDVGVSVVQGYGTTESGQIALEGHVVDGVDARLLAAPEHGMTPADAPHPRGELVVKTPGMFPGYYRDAAATVAAFTEDGYFRTGDLVAMPASRTVEVLGRAGITAKLDGGVFVNLMDVERRLTQASDAVEQVFVTTPTADRCPFLVAVVVPTGGSGRIEEAALLREVVEAGKRAGLRAHEMPQRLVAARSQFTVDNGLMNPTGKLVRPLLQREYGAELEACLADVAESGGAAPLHGAGVEEMWLRALRGSTHDPSAVFAGADSRELTFTEMGGDSLAAARVAAKLSLHFSAPVSAAMLLTDGATVSAVRTALASMSGAPSASADDSQRSVVLGAADRTVSGPSDITLPAEALPVHGIAAASQPRARADADVLLTGATGFLGPFVVASLLRRMGSAARVFCVVRAGDAEAASAKLWTAIAAAGVGTELREAAARVVAVPGDTTQPMFGLNGATLRHVLNNTRTVVHMAAAVDLVRPVEELLPANAWSCQEALRLTHALTGARLLYVSTTDVIDSAHAGHVEAFALPDHVLRTRSGYALSKAAGERVVVNGQRLGVDAGIVRLGFVGPHSETGLCGPADFVSRFITGVARLGAVPVGALDPTNAAQFLNVVPVDAAAEALAALALRASVDGRAFHVTGADASSISVVLRGMQGAGVDLNGAETYGEWVSRLLDDRDNPLLPVWDVSSVSSEDTAFGSLFSPVGRVDALRELSSSDPDAAAALEKVPGDEYWAAAARRLAKLR